MPAKNPVQVRSKEERDQIIWQYRFLPKHVVSKMRNSEPIRRIGFEDAIQVAWLALIRSAEIWDESRGVKFLTYAYKAIHNRVNQEGMICTLVHIPHYLFGRASRTTPEKTELARKAVCCGQFRIGHDDDVPYDEPMPEKEEPLGDIEALRNAISRMRQQHREVLQLLYQGHMTLQQAGDKLNLTRQRVQQIRDDAVRKLRFMLTGVKD